MESNGIMESKKSSHKFVCEACHYKCSYNSDWLKHLATSKHVINVKMEQKGIDESNFSKKSSQHFCDCGRSYSTKSNLGKHKKTCKQLTPNDTIVKPEEQMNIYDLVKYLMKENSELKNLLVDQSNKIFDQSNKLSDVTMELAKNGVNNTTNNTTTTTNTNSHNKAFNLNFFLNETCKNAMNINDFVDSIKLQLSDLISVGELGYVEGISNIIVKNLNALDETERPIHCTDKKRETIYIKDENQWEKDDEDNKKLRKFIKRIAYKNQVLFPKFKEKYPDYNDSESIHSDQYSKIVIESFDDNDKDKQDKIIRKISKEVLINK